MYLAKDVRRIEFHVVPAGEDEVRFTTTIVLPSEVVELTFSDSDDGARIAAELQTQLGLDSPPIGRARPLLRAYTCLPVMIILLGICALMGAAMLLMFEPPQSYLELWPSAVTIFATTGALYFVSRFTAASTARQYVQKEYGE
jgi:hypothetical protein